MAMPIIGACEPDSGSRYSAVKGMLAEAFRNHDLMQLVDRDVYDSVGMELTEEFTSYLEVLRAWASLPWQQKRAIMLWLGPDDMIQADIGTTMGCSPRTIRTLIGDGMNAMIKRIYG